MSASQGGQSATAAHVPTFTAFYRAINLRDPFPWQRRLADRLAETDEWPAEVGIPTGLGKTACLDIAVWWLASQAHRDPAGRTAPTRIWWVVNRRLLVDSTAEHAKRIAHALKAPGECDASDAAVLTAVADRLRALSSAPDPDPLEVVRLRGGIAWRRPTDPSQPAVLLSTLPMYGSRLLFRGYGSRRDMRSVDAALAGTDSLLLLDEAHLAPHLAALVPALADCTPGGQSILGAPRSRPRLVSLTATGDAAPGTRFNLDAEDEAHPVVKRRLHAAKPTEIRNSAAGDIAKRLAAAALDLVRDAPVPAAGVVFANTPATARATFDRLRQLTAHDAADVLLLTGRTREREAARIRKRVLDPTDGMASSRDPSADRHRHLIVVATQTLEVGADIDAEFLVAEACGVRALTQRLGRLNRLGRHPHARAVYVHQQPTARRRKKSGNADEWPVYGSEPAVVLRRLQAARNGSAVNVADLSPRRVGDILGPPGDSKGRAPEILPGLLWEWVKTTTPPVDEAPVEPYFSGITGPEYSVSLIWRAHVPNDGTRLWPRAMDREAVEVPRREFLDVLEEDEDLRRLASDGITVEKVSRGGIRPGDTILLRSDRGLLDEFGWNPSSCDPVPDVALPGRGLPLDSGAIRRLCGLSLGNLVGRVVPATAADDLDPDPAEQAAALDEILAALARATVPGWERDEWSGFVAALDRRVVEVRDEVPRLPVGSAGVEPHSHELDEMSLAETAVELNAHGRAVAARARRIAERLGLGSGLADATGYGGLFHDVGKADARFQRWLDPDEKHESLLLAKSSMPRHKWPAARVAAGWPRGGRHEALSARLVHRWLETTSAWADDPVLRDLVLHLVISHHGKGRPLVVPVADGTVRTLSTEIEGVAVRVPADLAVVDWDQPARFRRLNDRFGPWGLALLETIVRQADHQVSAGADAGNPPE